MGVLKNNQQRLFAGHQSSASSAQGGFALITALVIVSLVVALSIGIAASHDRSLWLSESRWHGNQALQYVYGAEQMAIYALNEDYKDDDENQEMVDHNDEIWAQPTPFELDEGWLEGNLTDAQSKLDINRLAEKVQNANNISYGATDPRRFTEAQRRFLRLLQSFEEQYPVDPSQAVEITEAIVDWIDQDDQDFGFGGAESLYYQRQDPIVTPPNGPMASVTELLLVRHMTPELYELIRPFLVALPGQSKGLNVNTADEHLLRVLNVDTDLQPLSAVDAESLVVERGATGFLDMTEFMESSMAMNLSSSGRGQFSQEGIVFNSEYFLLRSRIQVGRQRRTMNSLLYRENGQAKIVRRSEFEL
ncbi:hypothetical protein GCM10007877_28320 [Marinibactrum halimedae]|uniref:Type II secretion system protein K n=1 Tax=Marinibactrum halimedae TaxID=1444977 RepID=A0AA37T4R1_9GAMM|nr:hypothetical protein GCM10007877_28320 [Marinibactrum halimedae]